MDVTNAIQVVRMTDIGKVREHNEDAVASDLSIGLLMLADGMGGYKAGEVASEIALLTVAADLAESLEDIQTKKASKRLQYETQLLIDAVDKANDAIYDIAQQSEDCEGMGTTLVTAVFMDDKIIVGHVGDSRLYRLRDEKLTQLTEDHSVLQEQIKAGEITKQQAKMSENGHLVTRSLGTDDTVDFETNVFDTQTDDIYMLCSDGLTDLVDDAEIRVMLNEAEGDIQRASRNLIRFANSLGGIDNISIVMARVKNAFPFGNWWTRKFFSFIN